MSTLAVESDEDLHAMPDVRNSVTGRLYKIVGADRVLVNEPLARHTTFRIGGPADWLVFPETVADVRDVLAVAKDAALPWHVLGGGTNVLVRDGGMRGIVLNLGKGLRAIRVEEPDTEHAYWRLYAEAGVQLAAVLHASEKAALGGLEMTAGIPGSLGGALCMNAGTRAGEIYDNLETITLCRAATGTLDTVSKEDLPHAYRTVALPPGDIVLAAMFRMTPRPAEEIRNTVRSLKTARNESQPLSMPNAGCIFKNPPGQSAGRLIDEAGLKGTRRGGAEISTVHANFIVNTGDATASDVTGLITMIQKVIQEKHGIHLELEIRVVGSDV